MAADPTHPNPYVSAETLRTAIGASAYKAIFDDDGDGTVDAAAVDLVRSRASTRVDSSLAKIYPAAVVPFTGEVPRDAQEAALEFAVGMAYLRHPEYAARYGDKGKVMEFDRAEKLCQDLATNLKRIADAPAAAPNPVNVGLTVDFSASDDAAGGVGGGIFSGGFGIF